jgi:hypothetical protein
MAKVMFQFREPSGEPALDEVQRRFGLHDHEIDRQFGIVKVDEQEGLYTMLVDDAARERVAPNLDGTDPAVGFFSNPRIDTFGPPQP